MSRRPLPTCHICNRHYRGSYNVHASTESHRRKVGRQNNPADGGRRFKRRFVTVATMHSRLEREDASMVNVDPYYRNPPTPPWPAAVRDKVFYVVHHWRHPPQVLNRVHVTAHRRRRRRR